MVLFILSDAASAVIDSSLTCGKVKFFVWMIPGGEGEVFMYPYILIIYTKYTKY